MTVITLEPLVISPYCEDMKPDAEKGGRACGVIQPVPDCSTVAIEYREHDSRNGQLLVVVGGHRLDADQLISLSQKLQAEEQKLAIGRSWYADMALAHFSLLHHQEPASERE